MRVAMGFDWNPPGSHSPSPPVQVPRPKNRTGLGAAVARLAERLRNRIRDQGPIPFRDWMEACLYDPDEGYYMRPGPPRTGTEVGSDFATNPTLHPFFAQAVAREAEASWVSLGRPTGFQVVEYGGGVGDLARDALAWLDANVPYLAAMISWSHIERSPFHRGLQHSGDDRIQATDRMERGLVGLVLAHEFVDALPFHWLEFRKGGWAEVHVGLDGERFVEGLGIPSRTAIESAPKRQLPEGQRVVAMPQARGWLQSVAERLARGHVLIADYGGLGRDLWVPERPDGTVRAIRDHQVLDSPLAVPGTADITAHVDFTQLRLWALEAGLAEDFFESQEVFLARHGVLEVLASAPRSTVEEASAYLRLKQMVLPSGLGSVFRVQRFSKGLEEEG